LRRAAALGSPLGGGGGCGRGGGGRGGGGRGGGRGTRSGGNRRFAPGRGGLVRGRPGLGLLGEAPSGWLWEAVALRVAAGRVYSCAHINTRDTSERCQGPWRASAWCGLHVGIVAKRTKGGWLPPHLIAARDRSLASRNVHRIRFTRRGARARLLPPSSPGGDGCGPSSSRPRRRGPWTSPCVPAKSRELLECPSFSFPTHEFSILAEC
jgi:hypothetical protein